MRWNSERADLTNVVLEVTPACNNACLHCYNFWRGNGEGESRGRVLSCAEILSVVKRVSTVAPLTQIALSGGEPLLRPDLPEIVNGLTDLGVRPVVITNAVLLNRALLRRIPTGTIFEVTLFSAEAALHDRIAGRACFHTVLKNIVLLEQTKQRFALAFVLMSLNAHDTERTLMLGLALGAEAVLLNRVNLTSRTLPNAARIVPSAALLQSSLRRANAVAAKFGTPIAVSVPVPPCVVDPGEFAHLHFGWCPRGGEGSYYTIGWDGGVRPCNHSSVVLGDVRQMDVLRIIEGPKARGFWDGTPPECVECKHPLRDACRGGCPAASDECYGARTSLDPFVRFALAPQRKQAGLRLPGAPKSLCTRELPYNRPRARPLAARWAVHPGGGVASSRPTGTPAAAGGGPRPETPGGEIVRPKATFKMCDVAPLRRETSGVRCEQARGEDGQPLFLDLEEPLGSLRGCGGTPGAPAAELEGER